ncbi:callose synthase 11 isoform X2 [Prunus yedoensis var. nudiflora]|uniref:Callose synthase 11 isoform X2 n=1 Tax=Prunus yedoensis var. nudiflora TaxID=2094558 RepID=A0A314UGX3_PRUYE|nr:callose synthase 11 isoform X2 [Prunus yedoensis var. nudiflora]
MLLGVRMVLKGAAAATWTIVFSVFYARIWDQKNSDGRWSDAANQRIIVFLEAALVFVIPEVLALVLFIVPWVRNFLEGLDFSILYAFTWWFHTRIFVGRGLREGLINNVKYTMFWIAVLASKFTFSYFLQIRPLVSPTKTLLDAGDTKYKIHIFFNSGNRIAIVLLWIPVVLIYLMDLQICALQFNLIPEEESLRPEATMVKKLRDAIHRLKLRYGLGQAYQKTESSQVEATSQATELGEEPDQSLWLKICKSEYRRCAVIEAYDSVKYLLLVVVKYGTEENSIVSKIFKELDECIQSGKVTVTYKLSLLPQIHAKLISLIELLIQRKKDESKAVNVLQALYELSVREFPRLKKSMETLRLEGLATCSPATVTGLLFENAIQFPDDEDAVFFRHLRRLHTILTSRDSMHNVPTNIEARRRIAFFSNSLFMNMPRAPYVEKMMAFSVLTPYYDEEVMYGKEFLRSENEDGISTLFYLQKIYEDEWKHFMERMYREGMENDDEIYTKKARDLRLWASHRGQTLSRTVRGMMYYYRALKMLAFLDSASEMDIRDGSQQIGSHVLMNQNSGLDGVQSAMQSSSRKLGRTSSSVSYLFKGHEHGIALLKFTYVVACQLYGQQKTKGDSRAEEILYLMKNNEALRVAYVDEMQREVEIYRIMLPGPLKLGEGKPENQNHAIIFTRGDAVQTIDMNQDNYFEEALKMRNLLEEFKNFYGIRRPTILGVRENIFTGSVSSLAWFMSAQEMSFVTLNQRVLANPLKVRMHYGHPDVFDRFWFLPRGGISKASKVINISEDIFAGFNCTLRGGNVTHHEYIQVGKGRDVGLNQISMFEAKVASGSGEQVLSRDVYRLGHRLDFFRMLSFFYSTVGFYFNTMMVILTVYAFLWGRLFLALSGIKDSANNKSLGVILNQQFIIQLGFFSALPMIVENSLELGFLRAVWDFLTMQLQLASVFYTFSMGTRTHFFGRTILHGGAKYRATGRGFVVQHKSFAENYRLYARSHFVKAIELGIILVVFAAHNSVKANTFVYIAMTISSWCLVLSWIMGPFVFNPSGFDWLKTVYDFDDFMNWLWYSGGVFTKAEQSWETWWYEEQDHLRTTGLWGKLLEILLDLRFFFFQYGVVYHLGITRGNTSIAVYLLSWIYMVGGCWDLYSHSICSGQICSEGAYLLPASSASCHNGFGTCNCIAARVHSLQISRYSLKFLGVHPYRLGHNFNSSGVFRYLVFLPAKSLSEMHSLRGHEAGLGLQQTK